MDKDIRSIGAARDETIAFAAVEPFHDRVESRAVRFWQRSLGFRGVLRNCSRVVQGDETTSLQPFRSLHCLTDDLGTFVRRLETGLSDTGLVKQDISRKTTGRFYESIPLGRIEPFDQTADLLTRLRRITCGLHPPIGAHENPQLLYL